MFGIASLGSLCIHIGIMFLSHLCGQSPFHVSSSSPSISSSPPNLTWSSPSISSSSPNLTWSSPNLSCSSPRHFVVVASSWLFVFSVHYGWCCYGSKLKINVAYPLIKMCEIKLFKISLSWLYILFFFWHPQNSLNQSRLLVAMVMTATCMLWNIVGKYSLCHFVRELSYQLRLQSKYIYQHVWAQKLK